MSMTSLPGVSGAQLQWNAWHDDPFRKRRGVHAEAHGRETVGFSNHEVVRQRTKRAFRQRPVFGRPAEAEERGTEKLRAAECDDPRLARCSTADFPHGEGLHGEHSWQASRARVSKGHPEVRTRRLAKATSTEVSSHGRRVILK